MASYKTRKMNKEESVIYGVESQARVLTSQTKKVEKPSFLIGTQSLKGDNQIHQVEYEDFSKPLKATVYEFCYGDIWKLSVSAEHSKRVAICYGTVIHEHGYRIKSMIGRLSQSQTTFEYFIDEEMDLNATKNNNFVATEFHPNNDNLVASVLDRRIETWDLSKNSKSSVFDLNVDNTVDKSACTTGKWCPSNSWNQFTVALRDELRSYDLRNGNLAWNINCGHSNTVRDFDFNLNKQFIVASCGDDGRVKIWDYRYPKNFLLSRPDHTHWVWAVKFNPFYDQLIMTGGSDGKMILTSVNSISSEYNEDLDATQQIQGIPDGVLHVCEHEDSVYSIDWSTYDPWIMASLSYDGRLIINNVHKQYKYQIIAM